jgi:[lysine-biosynthesis-protein LysW]--L-2-aminoadipate ligase
VRLAVLASRVRLDEKRVFAALDRRAVRYEYVDSRVTWSVLSGGTPRWDVVLNREIGYARAVHAAWALEAEGSRVVNSAIATEVCGDKWRTSIALREASVPVPRTALALTPQAALDALEVLGYPAVVKPLVGSWGRLVTLLPDRATAEAVLEHVAALPGPQSHVVYLQELVPKADRDIRVLVVGGEALGAVSRNGDQWRTNVARGARAQRCELGPALAKLALTAAGAVGAGIAGVDLVEAPDGRLLVLEVNHGVEFSGFQEAMGTRTDVADRIIDYVLAVEP